MKGGKYARTLAKNQFFGTFHIRAVSEEMFRHVGAYPNGHQHGGRKPTETFVTEFCYKSVNLFLEEVINITVMITELFR